MQELEYTEAMYNEDLRISRIVLYQEYKRGKQFGDDNILAYTQQMLHKKRKDFKGKKEEYYNYAKTVAHIAINAVIEFYK